MNWKIYKLWDILTRKKLTINILNDISYKRITIKPYWKGVLLRDQKLWKNILIKKQFIINEWQFIISINNANNWVFWVVSKECDNSIITWNFRIYDINKKIVNTDWIKLYFTTDYFINNCSKSSFLSKNKEYLNEIIFLNQELYIPNIETQNNLIKIYFNKKTEFDEVLNKLNDDEYYIKQLKQVLLTDLIKWGPTIAWREDNPLFEKSSFLLEKIKKEKLNLIYNLSDNYSRKIQEKLKEIKTEEMPFIIPESWIWCRLDDIINIYSKNNFDNNLDLSFIPKKLIKDWFKYKYSFEIKKIWKIIVWYTYFFKKGFLFIKFIPSLKNKKSTNRKILHWWVLETELIVIKIFKKFTLPKLLFYFIKNDDFFKFYISKITLSKWWQKLDINVIKNLLFPLPPFKEQKELVKSIEKFMRMINVVEKKRIKTKKIFEDLVKTSLNELFVSNLYYKIIINKLVLSMNYIINYFK